ncbi:MAG TPA: MFS transporter [Candidatus Saccharimonadales bacterium]|nr:MFS transporter [Candidatus Saccharimonadales bacterium]
MNEASHRVQRTYLTLLLFNTLAASLIWGINTLFLLNAGLSNVEAFAANAFYTVGLVLFEVPTGVVADLKGRRASYLIGTVTLAAATILYWVAWEMHAPFWAWAVTSMLLGLGFTFFSGSVEAWLVDALHYTGYKGKLESVFAKGQAVQGFAMLSGSVAGGFIAQIGNLGAPYIGRAILLAITFILAFWWMKDLGFTPLGSKQPLKEVKHIVHNSVEHGFKRRPIRWIMLAGLFTSGVSVYAFYATQPYLLELYGDSTAYGVAGLAAAIVAGAQIVGGLMGPRLGRLFKRRTSFIIANVGISAVILLSLGLVHNFWFALAALTIWGLLYAAVVPVRQAYLNGLISSDQRATVLSFDSLFSSAGGVVSQPVLGKVADAYSYATSFVASSVIQIIALPFAILARREKTPQDVILDDPTKPTRS